MPRAAKLKVFRTSIGFHDAYVAAPSQKAAMAAWGSDGDLFARGEAELVTDSALAAEPLARPGVVIKRLRGTAAEQIAALAPDKPRSKKADPEHVATEPAAPPASARKQAPRPSRAALDRAVQALTAAEERHRTERDALAEREAELTRERRALEKAQAAEARLLEQARDTAAGTYESALRKWRG